MYMGWYGQKEKKYPVSIYKDKTNGNDGFIHDFKHFSEVQFTLICYIVNFFDKEIMFFIYICHLVTQEILGVN